MAVPNWSDPGQAQLTGLTEPMLIRLIDASNQAGGQMKQLRGHVDGAAGNIRAAMDSDAGKILGQRLETWHADFLPIINLFVDTPQSLTERSTQMLAALRKANADSTASAGSGQG
jgi:hypothetical protein